MIRKVILGVVLISSLWSLYSCVTVKCREDMAYNFDRYGRPMPNTKKKDPPAILMQQCPIDKCSTRKVHCHGDFKYRGSPWYKNQNPKVGQGVKPIKE